jgi:hypothetical protein
MDQSCVSRRTRKSVLNMETLSTTTILSQFPPRDLNMSSIAVLALKNGNHVLKTLRKVQPCGKCDWCSDKFHCPMLTLQKNSCDKGFSCSSAFQKRQFLFGCIKHVNENTELFIIQSFFQRSSWKVYSTNIQ